MILGLIVLLVVAGIAYWHYAQGFFSSIFSALAAVIAAVLAVSYHEPVVASLLRGKIADYANGLALIALFALIYIIIRTAFDNLVPGNVRLLVMVDRIGGAVMGLIVGIFATGIFVLPAGQSRNVDVTVDDQLKEDRFESGSKKSLIIPVDDIVLATVAKLSDGGSLAGAQALTAVHPDYADELFGQRLGVQVGAKRTAINLDGGKAEVRVADPGVFHFDKDVSKTSFDGELPQVHQRGISLSKPAPPDDYPLVVRVMFDHSAADEDGLVRVSCASVRLVAEGTNYWPVGTVEGGMLLLNKMDDFLLVNVKDKDRGADFLFLVDPKKVMSGNEKDKDQKINDGVFLEVKRMAQVDLGGKAVEPVIKRSADIEVMRKPAVKDAQRKKETPQIEAGAGPIIVQSVTVSDKLFTAINVGIPDATANSVQLKSGTCSLKDQKFTKLSIEPVDSVRLLAQGSFGRDTFFITPGQRMVQVAASPPAEGGDAWAWANNIQKFALLDANGKSYKPAGGWAKVKQQQADRMVASYDYAGGSPVINQSEGRPTDVWIAFLVPQGTQLRTLMYEGKALQDLNNQTAD